MNKLTLQYLMLLASFLNFGTYCQTTVGIGVYPSLDSSYTSEQISAFVQQFQPHKTDTVGVVYAYGVSITNANATSQQRTDALYYFIANQEFTQKIPRKDAIKIQLAIISYYVGADPRIVEEKVREIDSLITITRKRKWDILSTEAYLLKYYLKSRGDFTVPYPDELIKVYEEFNEAIRKVPDLNSKIMLMVGRYYQQQRNFIKAISFYEDVLEFANTRKDPFASNFSMLFLAQSHRLNDEIEKAKHYAHLVLENCISSKELSCIDHSRWASEELAQAYKAEGNYKKATYYWELYDAKIKEFRRESAEFPNVEPLLIQKIENDLAERKIREELQQKLVTETSRRNKLLLVTNVLVLAFSLILFVIGTLWYKQRRRRLFKESEVAIAASREEERETIARELHDHVGNTLIAVKNAIPKSVKNYLKITDAINEIYAVIRQSSHALSTAGLTTVGLAESCKDYIQLIDKEKIIKMSVVGEERNIPLNLSKEAFRITQELIQNTLKYSNASEINFALLINPDSLILNVEDDGIGFENSSTNSGIGLKNIKERVKRLAGDITIDTSHTYGASFWISLPIKD